ncbi:MFS transporter [Gemmatimonas sp. UBA7669]|uniref:MFS transporter n=1 Tax=Gemmatimonas sp. UBA7669 TaxID=1946568 RepID=UPI0025BBD36F|nr:MFS transporter [Gemmatimonas sp. UBA7669]
MFTLFLVVFLDLIGFGMIIPVFPFYAERIGVAPSSVIFFLGLYSVGQLVGAPLWGGLSDRIGRRPVLLATLLANAAASWMLAYADTGLTLAISRIISGLAAGNISTAYAYTTDITTDATRPKALGLLGSAFGMGFILGPALGGLLAGNADDGSSMGRVAHAAALLSLLAFALTVFRLPESLPPEARRSKTSTRQPLSAYFRRPILRDLLFATLVVVAAVAIFQSTMALFGAERLGIGPRTLGWVYGITGAISVSIQAGVIGRLTQRFGAPALAQFGTVMIALGLAGIPLAQSVFWLCGTLALFAVGSACFNPSMSGLVAAAAEPHERGGVLGAHQGAASLGRVVGPMVASGVAQLAGLTWPFVVGAAVCVLGTVLLRAALRAPHHQHVTSG